jgi:hypothetical protein
MKISAYVSMALMIGTAQAGSTAAINCASCTDLTALHTTAYNWYYNNTQYIPATLIVTALGGGPVAGVFHAHLACAKRCILQVLADPAVSTNYDAWQFEERMFARASKYERPITVGSPPFSLDSTISLEVERQITFVPNGDTGINWIHFVVPVPGGGISYWTYHDTATGDNFQLFVGDMMTVTYPGGFQDKVQFQGADKTPANRWKHVPNTLMLNGKPYSGPTTLPGTPIQAYQSAGGANAWGAGKVLTQLDFKTCSGVSSVTLTLDGEGFTNFGIFTFQC